MPGNSKHSKNNLKIYVITLTNFYVVDGRTLLFFYMSVNKSSYIYLIILLFESNSRIFRYYIIIYWNKGKISSFLLFTLPQKSDGPLNV